MTSDTPQRVQWKKPEHSKLPTNANPFIGGDAVKWFRLWQDEFPTSPTGVMIELAQLVGDDVRFHESFEGRRRISLEELLELAEVSDG